jgi:protein-S-isoprenylcysteine O-methyltransferase Ste14
MIGLKNLWIIVVSAHVVIFAMYGLTGIIRGRGISDWEQYKSSDARLNLAVGWIWSLAVFVVTLFIPIEYGVPFWFGLFFLVLGMGLYVCAFASFVRFSGGLNMTGIYKYSRNPMYIGTWTMMLAFCIMGWFTSYWCIALIVLSVASIPYFNWTVLGEEQFLEQKYGDPFIEYKKEVPRYLSVGGLKI